jgi:hypothetical protein
VGRVSHVLRGKFLNWLTRWLPPKVYAYEWKNMTNIDLLNIRVWDCENVETKDVNVGLTVDKN